MKLAEAFKKAVSALKELVSAIFETISTALGKLRFTQRMGIQERVNIYIDSNQVLNHRQYSVTEVSNVDRLATMQKNNHRRSQGTIH